MLRDRQRDSGDVDFLKGVAADSGWITWPVMATTGTESSIASASPVTRLWRPVPR